MRARLDSLEELFKQLKDAPAPKAQRMFKRLRTNIEIQTLLEDLDDHSGGSDEGSDAGVIEPDLRRDEEVLSELARRASTGLYPSTSETPSSESHTGPVSLS